MVSGHAFRGTIAQMVYDRQKIQAVKAVKDFYGIGLKEGKDLVDAIEHRDWQGRDLARSQVEQSVDRVFDHYEHQTAPMSSPITSIKAEKKASDVAILADALAEQIWARLEEKLSDVVHEVVAWDIQQLRNEINVVGQHVQDLAHGQ